MKDQTTSKVPRIRFKGFEGDWEYKKLSELTETGFTNGIFNDPNKVGRGYRLINVKDMFSGSSIDVENLSFIDINEHEFKKNRVRYGDIFFTRSSLVKEGIACSNVNLSTHRDITFDGHLIRMQPCRKITDSIFLSYAFKTGSSRRQFILGGKTTTMTTIGQSDIAVVEVALPTKTEQTQIGKCFRELDCLIGLHQRKHDKLVTLKKAMLQKMFPQPGTTMPEIRFKGFEGEWVDKKLGEVMTVGSVKRIHQSDWTKAGVRFLRARDIVSAYKNEDPAEVLYISQSKYDEYSVLSGKVEFGDLLVTGVGTIGIPYLIRRNDPIYFKDGNIIWFKNQGTFNGNFLYYSFVGERIQNYIKESAGTGTVGTYTISSGKDTPLTSPLLEEQQKIGTYFRQLDELISKHAIQLQKLKQVKSACLEKMFV